MFYPSYMKVYNLITKLESNKPISIFSIDVWEQNIITACTNGDLDFYKNEDTLYKTVKKHSGAILCVRFNQKGTLISSCGDDGTVIIYDLDLNVLNFIKEHKGDVTNVLWTEKYLISVGHDGFIVFYDIQTFKIIKKLKSHENKITGIGYTKKSNLICTQGDDGIILYKGTNMYKKIPPNEGVILESFFSRMSWSPDGTIFSCGLSFNQKVNSIEIYNIQMESKYSLLGHVAPCEVTCFNPNVFTNGTKQYFILAVGSQDLSISLWNTLSPYPFLLLKNVCELPILDLMWSLEGTSLYYCSYDGSVGKLEFDFKELGELSSNENTVENSDLFLTLLNGELYDKKVHKMIREKIPKPKLEMTNKSEVIIKENKDVSPRKENCESSLPKKSIISNHSVIKEQGSIKDYLNKPKQDNVQIKKEIKAVKEAVIPAKINYQNGLKHNMSRIHNYYPLNKNHNGTINDIRDQHYITQREYQDRINFSNSHIQNYNPQMLYPNYNILPNYSKMYNYSTKNEYNKFNPQNEYNQFNPQNEFNQFNPQNEYNQLNKDLKNYNRNQSISTLQDQNTQKDSTVSNLLQDNKVKEQVSSEQIKEQINFDNKGNTPSFNTGLKLDDFKEKEKTPVTKTKVIKRKVVTPVVIEDKKSEPKEIAMFNFKQSIKVENGKIEEYYKEYDDYSIELNTEKTKLDVKRFKKSFYEIHGDFKFICTSKKYICVYTTNIEVYELRTGSLVCPHIGSGCVIYIDIYKDMILYLEGDGTVTIYNFKTNNNITTRIPRYDTVIRIKFSKYYFVKCEYKDTSYILDKDTRLWYLLDKQWNDVTTKNIDFENTVDESLKKLENKFILNYKNKRHEKLKKIVKRMVSIVINIKFTDYLENVFKRIFKDMIKLGHKKFTVKCLEKLSKNFSLQYFIVEIMKSM